MRQHKSGSTLVCQIELKERLVQTARCTLTFEAGVGAGQLLLSDGLAFPKQPKLQQVHKSTPFSYCGSVLRQPLVQLFVWYLL